MTGRPRNHEALYLVLGLVLVVLVAYLLTNTTHEDKTIPYNSTLTPTMESELSTPTVFPIIVMVNPTIPVGANPTAATTPTATPVPTAMLTPTVTPIPTATPIPTVDPQIGITNYENIRLEIGKMLVGTDILIDRSSAPRYDLYTVISTEGVDNAQLFKFLRTVFTEDIAHWINIRHTGNFEGTDSLRVALESSICPTCKKPTLKNDESNKDYMTHILDSISDDDIHNANDIMLDFLYRYTMQSNNGVHERVLIVCDD